MRKRIRRWTVTLAAVALVGAPRAALVAQDADRAALLELNKALLESMLVQRDATLFARTAVQGVIVIPPGGIVEDRDQAIAGLANFRVSSITLDDIRIVSEGSATVVIGRLTPRGELRGGGALGPMRFLNVYVKSTEGWRLLARSLTPCAERAIIAGRC